MEESHTDTTEVQVHNSNGVIEYATADDLLAAAPLDIQEKDVTDVFGGKTVRIRGLTAAQAAHVKSVSFQTQGRTPSVAWGQMEIEQFKLGVLKPKLEHNQVVMLHRMSGPSFAKVIAALDELSGIEKDELREAQKEFQDTEQSDSI